MAFEQLKAEIAMLVQQMDDEPEDVRELMRAFIEGDRTEGPGPAASRRSGSARTTSRRRRALFRALTRFLYRTTAGPAPSRRQPAGRSRRPAARKKASPAERHNGRPPRKAPENMPQPAEARLQRSRQGLGCKEKQAGCGKGEKITCQESQAVFRARTPVQYFCFTRAGPPRRCSHAARWFICKNLPSGRWSGSS